MNLKDQIPIVFLLLLMHGSSCVKQIYKKTNVKEKFVNLAAVSYYVYIGGSQTITLLNSSLKFLHKVSIKSDSTEYPSNWLMIPQGEVLIVCNYNTALSKTLCIQYNVANQFDENIDHELKLKSFIIEKPGSDFIPVIVEENNRLFIASSDCIKHSQRDTYCRSISGYKLTDKINYLQFDDVKYNVVYNEGSDRRVNFMAALINDKFIYFLFGVNKTHSKLGKICTENNAIHNSYEDIPIQCNHAGKLYTAAIDAVFWSEQNYLFVTFSDDISSVVCRYELKSIKKKFMESRKDRLKCPYVALHNSIFSNNNQFIRGEWCFNTTANQCESNKVNKHDSCPEVTDEKNGFCSTWFFGSVEGQLPLVSVNVIYNRMHSDTGPIIKLAAVTQTTYAVIYAGTEAGKLGKIFAKKRIKESNFTNFITIEKLSPILDIKVNCENVYVMTENLVVNVGGIEDCPNFGGCEGCMESENPLCGWDVLKNTCNKNNNQPFWVPSAGRKCLRLITKDVKLEDKQGSNFAEPIFTVEPDVDILTDRFLEARCRINGKIAPDNVQLIPSLVEQQYYSCGLFEFNRSGAVTMALQYNEILVVNATLNVYECPQFNSCYECVRGRECWWCPQTFSCTSAICSSGAVNNTGESMCPRIDSSKSLFITANKAENVIMQVPNFDVYNKLQHLFKCVVGTNKYNIVAKGDTVTCIDVIIGKEDNIRLQYNSSNLLDDAATLKVYQCQSLNAGKHCGYCKYLRSQNYKCDWCENSCMSTLHPNTCSEVCDVTDRIISGVYPPYGPFNGGTVINITGQNIGSPGDNISVRVYGVECTAVNVIEPSYKINCITGKLTTNNYDLTVSVNGIARSYSDVQYYTYEAPVHETSLNFTPDRCILSGGRTITITGDKNYFDYADDSRFQVSFCKNMNSCINCRNVKSVGHNSHKITCRMDKSDNFMELTKLKVIVDSFTSMELQKSFNVVPNPAIIDLSPEKAKVFGSGGSKLTINGKGFNYIDVVRMERVLKSCDIKSDARVVCETPPYAKSIYERRRRSTGQNVLIKYDNYAHIFTIYYVDDPFIYEFSNTIDYKAGSSLVIMGKNLLEGATQDDYLVHIGLSGLCVLENITNEKIICKPSSTVPLTNHSNEYIVSVLVQVGRFRHNVGFLKYSSEIPLTTILISVLSAVVVVVKLTIWAVIFIKRRKKKIAKKNSQMELLTREASREEFDDAQMTIRDIKSDLVKSRVPFFDYQTYVFNQLFPNQDINKHTLLHEPMVIDDNRQRVQEAMVMFDKLMTDKLFLKSLVQTLENQKGLSMQDKAHFACTLSVAFLGNMRLFYELVSSLLIDMIQSSHKKQHNVLFKRFDSITQRLMVNWLELSLYEHLKKQSGMQLFMLYKATQAVIEKGPIDAVTNHCRNTLAADRLLKNRVECETLTLRIDPNGNSDNHIPVTVLDCDTITQVKQKCITAIYKNKPASEIPTVNELELEWHRGRSAKLVLQDIDKISERCNGMVRLNTLKHYIVKNGSKMSLVYKTAFENKVDELYGNQRIANDHNTSPRKVLIPECLEEHLSNLTDEEKSQDHEIGELFLNRLFHTKLILRDYIDAAFKGIMNSQSLSVPVRYFLCMIDKQAKAVGADNDAVQAWKSECYATRVWASLISRPQILFDVVVPSHVEPCMDILKQVFIDSFTQEPQNVSNVSINQESSTQKLLFFKDVLEYRKHVDSFFLRVESVSDSEFLRAIDEISSVQSRDIKFNRLATLHQLYNIVAKYMDEIVEGFSETNETNDFDFDTKLEAVSEKMDK